MAKKFSGISYYGGQNGSGHYQVLINHIPKSDIYIEGFLGMSGVFNNLSMSPASQYFGFDRDPAVLNHWRKLFPWPHSHFLNADYSAAQSVLAMSPGKRVFVHFDPPYRNTRSPKKYIYDLRTDAEYELFFETVLSMSVSCNVMISHWRDSLFDLRLTGAFVHIPFKTMTQNGQIDNGIYINYDPSSMALADTNYVGLGFTDRQRIKRKVERNYRKIMSMPAMERDLLLSRLLSMPAEGQSIPTMAAGIDKPG